MRQRRFFLAGAFAISLLASAPVFAQDVTLSTNASGITIGGVKPSWSTGFGTVNGLGLGTPGANETILAPSGGNGVLYTSPYNIVVTGTTTHPTVMRAYVSTNFTHTAILSVYSCTASCTSGSSYAALSTNSGSPTDIILSPGLTSQTVTRYLGVFVSNQNGAAAFTGSDSATITVLVYDGSNNSLKKTYTLALNNPNETVQTALRLTLATASGGRTISTASDFSLAFGNVNALGISPGSGITVAGVSGGELYGTPYLLKPLFSSFSSTTGTLKAYVSTDFGHPSQLELRDSSSGVTYSALSKSSGSQTLLTSSASSGSTVTRYVGLFVSNTNGGSVFTGADNATVTFTLVVP